MRDQEIQIIAAPSILGLRPSGVELMAERLLAAGLQQQLQNACPVLQVPTMNEQYSYQRDPVTNCLNTKPAGDFSVQLSEAVSKTIATGRFPLVLGGDCSILIGIMAGLKAMADYGLVFMDAHADFYVPEQSITGELADMDLAIVTGNGPDMLININGLGPYVQPQQVVHLGQRDMVETIKYGAQDIGQTGIKCFDLEDIQRSGVAQIAEEVMEHITGLPVERFWLHYDTDVLADDINPAVDYRLPGGLTLEQVVRLQQALLSSGKIAGMSVTIFNPLLDQDGHIASVIVEGLGEAFNFRKA
jgi:arginase